MSRPKAMIDSPYTGRPIPQSEHTFLHELFERNILSVPGGVVMRMASVVKNMTSETALITASKARGLSVVRAGTHYFIFNGDITFRPLLGNFAMEERD